MNHTKLQQIVHSRDSLERTAVSFHDRHEVDAAHFSTRHAFLSVVGTAQGSHHRCECRHKQKLFPTRESTIQSCRPQAPEIRLSCFVMSSVRHKTCQACPSFAKKR